MRHWLGSGARVCRIGAAWCLRMIAGDMLRSFACPLYPKAQVVGLGVDSGRKKFKQSLVRSLCNVINTGNLRYRLICKGWIASWRHIDVRRRDFHSSYLIRVANSSTRVRPSCRFLGWYLPYHICQFSLSSYMLAIQAGSCYPERCVNVSTSFRESQFETMWSPGVLFVQLPSPCWEWGRSRYR